MLFTLYLRLEDDTVLQTVQVTSVNFSKDVYTPYTSLSVMFLYNQEITQQIIEVELKAGSKTIHHGFIDRYKVFRKDGVEHKFISSRGFTAALADNQLEPGMYTGTSLNSLFENYIHMPHVTHEYMSEQGYVHIKKGTPMWDGVAALAYKQHGQYPYIRGTNTVQISMPSNARENEYTDDEVAEVGEEINTTRLASDYHMENISGEYGSFDVTEPEAARRKIVRHRYFELDYRFLYDPIEGCYYRDAIAMRGFSRRYFRYVGYKYEDLNDIATYGDIQGERIKAIRIVNNKKGFFTELSFYKDKFCE